MLSKIILTVIVFADVVKNHSCEEVEVLQGLVSLHPDRRVYTAVWEVPSIRVTFQAANTMRPIENINQ